MGVKISLAAPRHQEMNGVHESNWRYVREIAFSMLNQAQLGMEFFDFAIEQAWKVHSVLPHRHLTGDGGEPRCPIGVFTKRPIKLNRFRVMFCPVIAATGSKHLVETADNQKVLYNASRQNEPQRGYRGIHVGVPRNAAGWLIYDPKNNNVNISRDVYFDEGFTSTLVYDEGRFPKSFRLLRATYPANMEGIEHFHHTGPPQFTTHETDDNGNQVMVFAEPNVEELAAIITDDETDDDIEIIADSERWNVTQILEHSEFTGQPKEGKYRHQLKVDWEGDWSPTWEPAKTIITDVPEIVEEYAQSNNLLNEYPFTLIPEAIKAKQLKLEEMKQMQKRKRDKQTHNDNHNKPTRRSTRRRKQHAYSANTNPPTHPFPSDTLPSDTRLQEEEGMNNNDYKRSDEHTCYIPSRKATRTCASINQTLADLEERHAILAMFTEHVGNINIPSGDAHGTSYANYTDIAHELHNETSYEAETHFALGAVASGMEPKLFLPAPDCWKDIMKVRNPKAKAKWLEALDKEVRELINKGTFSKDEPVRSEDRVIPITVKFRVKLNQDGWVDKLKARIAYRGDLVKKGSVHEETWCPVAGFRALRFFLAEAVAHKQRVYQLDFVAAFLQSKAIGRKFTSLPAEWAELFPDLTEWFGKPLLLLKSLYGDTIANLAWDKTLAAFLTKPDGLAMDRLQSEGSIYIKRKGNDILMVLTATDDQLYFATNPELKKEFEKQIASEFHVDLLGQAAWYLQSRIQQHTDFSITLDQTRYARSIGLKYLPDNDRSGEREKMINKYAAPLPQTVRLTMEDKSENYAEVRNLETDFGFDYAGAVGSLIYLLNTYPKINFAVRKLARFMALPGKEHFKALKHLLMHVKYHAPECGIRFYSDVSKSPVYKKLTEIGCDWVNEHPIHCVSDSSFQDCPDTGRSTGGYMIMMQGGVIDAATVTPSIVTHSTGEAEYCTAALAVMQCNYFRKLYNEVSGKPADTHLTIPLGVDSKAASDMAASEKDTKKTRHVARRYHYLRECVSNAEVKLFQMEGEHNWSNCLTKPETKERVMREARIFQVISPIDGHKEE